VTSRPGIISCAALSPRLAWSTSDVDDSSQLNKKTPALFCLGHRNSIRSRLLFTPITIFPAPSFYPPRTRIYTHVQPPFQCMPSTTPPTPVASSASLNAQLLGAVVRADEHGVRSLLERGADVNATDAKGRSTIACAVAGERYACHDHLESSHVLNTLRSLQLADS
jgi:hypothetical protein